MRAGPAGPQMMADRRVASNKNANKTCLDIHTRHQLASAIAQPTVTPKNGQCRLHCLHAHAIVEGGSKPLCMLGPAAGLSEYARLPSPKHRCGVCPGSISTLACDQRPPTRRCLQLRRKQAACMQGGQSGRKPWRRCSNAARCNTLRARKRRSGRKPLQWGGGGGAGRTAAGCNHAHMLIVQPRRPPHQGCRHKLLPPTTTMMQATSAKARASKPKAALARCQRHKSTEMCAFFCDGSRAGGAPPPIREEPKP